MIVLPYYFLMCNIIPIIKIHSTFLCCNYIYSTYTFVYLLYFLLFVCKIIILYFSFFSLLHLLLMCKFQESERINFGPLIFVIFLCYVPFKLCLHNNVHFLTSSLVLFHITWHCTWLCFILLLLLMLFHGLELVWCYGAIVICFSDKRAVIEEYMHDIMMHNYYTWHNSGCHGELLGCVGGIINFCPIPQ